MIVKIAFLNLFRNKRRSAFNIIAVGLSLSAFLMYTAFMNGEKDIMYNLAVKFLAGHVQVHQQGYDAKADLRPADITLSKSSALVKRVEAVPHVIETKRRIEFFGFLGDGRNKIGGMISGVHPPDESREVFADSLIVSGDLAGRFIEKGNEVLIGEGLAKLFGLKPGDELTVTAEDKFKRPNIDSFTIVGIFNSGFPLFDETSVFIPLASAVQFMGYDTDEVNVVHIKVDHMDNVDAAQAAIAAAAGADLEVFDWRHFSPEIVNAVRQDKISYFIIMGIMLFLMVFGLMNTMSMNVFERYQEIGTLRAIGFRKRDITALFAWEALFTGLFGLIVALILGSIMNYYTSTVGFEIPQELLQEAKIPFVERMTSKPMWQDVWQCTLLAILTPVLGILRPTYKALKKSVVEELYFIK
ncbi:ABC transporter permease [Planctomycetota bacterium]